MKTLIISVLGSIIAISFTFYLNLNRADIRYTLSEKIPVKFLEENLQESIQQLNVKNIGNNEAKKIKIDLKGHIIDYDILLYSKADSLEKFLSKNSLEIVYSSLPPEGSFKVIIKSIGNGIKEEDVSIAHVAGKGKSALSQEKYSYWNFFFPIAVIGYLLFGVKLVVNDHWVSKSRYSYNKVLNRKRPFYMGESKWDALRKEAIEQKINDNRFIRSHGVEKSNSFLVLSNKKPEYLNEEEWARLIHQAAESLTSQFEVAIASSYDEEMILDFLKIPKPEHLPEKEWKQIQTRLNDRYFYHKRKYRLNQEDILKNIQSSRPEGIFPDLWNNYQESLIEKYRNLLNMKLEIQYEPMKFLNNQTLNCLQKDDRDNLEKKAYKLELNKLPDVLDPKAAKKFLDGEKPAWMEDIDYELIKSRAETSLEVDRLKNENTQKATEILKKEVEVNLLKDTLDRKLRIIHDILNDPSAADRIEEHSNVFAPGNFENLKKLAKLNKMK